MGSDYEWCEQLQKYLGKKEGSTQILNIHCYKEQFLEFLCTHV